MLLFVLFLPLVVGDSYQLPTPYLTLNDNNVTEGQPIALRCSIYSPEPQPVTWYWRCGDSNMTGNASVGLHDTVLTFPSDRKYNGVVCYCKVRPSAANDSYSKMSNHLTINVRYTPRSIPFLNASNTAVVAGEEITLQCTLDTLGNPPVTWTWKCGRYAVYNQRTVNVNATSKLILKGEPDLNNKVCHCVARNYFLHYEAASNAVSLSVYYFPDERPRIDNTLITVDQNTPVTIRCYLSTRGNPPVAWLWYCDDKLQSKGVGSTGTLSTLMVIAKLKDHNAACHCRAKSDSQWGSYDKNSSKAIINIKNLDLITTKSSAITADVFGAVTGIVVLLIIMAGIVVVFHHRKITDMSNQFLTTRRDNDMSSNVGQDNLNYRTLKEEQAHPTE